MQRRYVVNRYKNQCNFEYSPLSTVYEVISYGQVEQTGRLLLCLLVELGRDRVLLVVGVHQLHHVNTALHRTAVDRHQALE